MRFTSGPGYFRVLNSKFIYGGAVYVQRSDRVREEKSRNFHRLLLTALGPRSRCAVMSVAKKVPRPVPLAYLWVTL